MKNVARVVVIGSQQFSLPTCKPPCRSVLTVVLTSEARLYRYLTCGGQSTNRRRGLGKICIVEKVSGI